MIEVTEFPKDVVTEYPEALTGKKYEAFLFLDLILFTEPYLKFLTNAERFVIKAAYVISHEKLITGLPTGFRDGCGFKLSNTTEVYSDSNLVMVAANSQARDSWVANVRVILESFKEIEKRKKTVASKKGFHDAGLSMYGDAKKRLTRIGSRKLSIQPHNSSNSVNVTASTNPAEKKHFMKPPDAHFGGDTDENDAVEGQKMQNALLLAQEIMARQKRK